MLKWLVLWLAVLLIGLAAACGGDDNGDPTRSTPAPSSPVATATITVGDDAHPVTPELRVAYINLESPVALDTTNSQASDTYDHRLAMVISELKDFRPDVVGFSEATNTKAHGNAVATLARELKMEPQTVRANPWFPDASTEQNDEIAKQSGFEEFEVILTRSAFPILKAESRWLNPRTSETE